MSVTNLLLIFSIIGSILIGFMVFMNNRRQATNRIFLAMSLSIAFWIAFNLMTNLASTNISATITARLAVLVAPLISYFIWILSYFFPSNKKFPKAINIFFILLIIIISPLTLTNLDIVNSSADGSIFIIGPVYIVATTLFIILILYGLINYIRIYRQATGKDREKIVLVIFGLFASAFFGFILTVILPVMGNKSALQASPIVTIIMLATLGFAIIRRKLFDLRLAVVRSLTYLLSLTTIAAIYGIVVFWIMNFITIGLSVSYQKYFYVGLTILVALGFPPLKRFYEKLTNKIFYQDRYESQDLINRIGKVLAGEIDLNRISNKVIDLMVSYIKIDKAEIVVFGHRKLFYENNVFKNHNDRISLSDLKKLGRSAVIAENLVSGERKDLLIEYGMGASFALHTSEKFIGYLLVGDKKSGDIFSDVDIDTMKIIANEISIAMANALSYKEIQLFNQTLSNKVRQRTEQLRKANSQLKNLDKAKDEFISMASHQLRTPLTTVKGYVSMLDEGDFGKLTKDQKDKVELVLNGSNKMARLIDDLLNVSRMDANRFFLEISDVDLNKIVKDELSQLQSWSQQDNLKLLYKAPKKKLPTIRLDENKTRQVVMNLVDNAMHYSKPGGGLIKVSLDMDGKYAIFKVEDDGIGVPKEAQSKLFTKMFRAENAKNSRPDGTGLGLYLVKRVIEEQGGEIIFNSQENKGSTFGFKLPLAGVPKETEKANAEIGTKVLSHPKYS